jgi:hypothetical protein
MKLRKKVEKLARALLTVVSVVWALLLMAATAILTLLTFDRAVA